MAQFVEALRYKPEGHGFDYQLCHWNFPLTYFFRPLYGPEVDSASNRNDYQEYFLEGRGGRCVGLTALPPSCAECREIWEPQTHETHQGLYRPVMGLFYLLCVITDMEYPVDRWIYSLSCPGISRKAVVCKLFIVKHNLLPVNTTIILIIIVLVLIHN